MGKRGHPCSASTSRTAAKASVGPDRARTVKLEQAEAPLAQPGLTSDSVDAPTLQMMGTTGTRALSWDEDPGTALGTMLADAERRQPAAEDRCTMGALDM